MAGSSAASLADLTALALIRIGMSLPVIISPEQKNNNQKFNDVLYQFFFGCAKSRCGKESRIKKIAQLKEMLALI